MSKISKIDLLIQDLKKKERALQPPANAELDKTIRILEEARDLIKSYAHNPITFNVKKEMDKRFFEAGDLENNEGIIRTGRLARDWLEQKG